MRKLKLTKEPPDVQQLILDDLFKVQHTLHREQIHMQQDSHTARQKGKKLLFLFQCDLLPGISGQILHAKGQRDFITAKKVSFAYKLAGWTFILLLNAGLLFYILLFALSQSDKQQGAWLQSFVLWLVVEILVVSTCIVLLSQVLIPLLTMKDVTVIKHRLMENIRQFHVKLSSAGNVFEVADGETEQPPFNAATYLFVSTRLALLYPDIKESQIIAQFSTPWPKQSYQHVTDVSKDYSK
eukprot:gene47294-biopygen7322